MSKENRVSDERLAEMLLVIGEPVEQLSISLPSSDLHLALTELQSLRSKPVAGVEVKPLEWHGPDVNGEYHARSVFGVYSIDTDFWLSLVGGHHASVEAAKEAAETDHRQRILSTLSLPAQEPVATFEVALLSKNGMRGVTHLMPETWWSKYPAGIHSLYASPQTEAVITEEMVERAAKAMFEEGSTVSWEEAGERAKTPHGASYGSMRGSFRRAANIALTAALKEA